MRKNKTFLGHRCGAGCGMAWPGAAIDRRIRIGAPSLASAFTHHPLRPIGIAHNAANAAATPYRCRTARPSLRDYDCVSLHDYEDAAGNRRGGCPGLYCVGRAVTSEPQTLIASPKP
jgi:hypothetical protein